MSSKQLCPQHYTSETDALNKITSKRNLLRDEITLTILIKLITKWNEQNMIMLFRRFSFEISFRNMTILMFQFPDTNYNNFLRRRFSHQITKYADIYFTKVSYDDQIVSVATVVTCLSMSHLALSCI